MSVDEEANRLRNLIASSPRWRLVALDLDFATVLKLPPVDVESWSPEERVAARQWAGCQGPEELPACLQRYVDAVKAASPN